jgi:hypothetical protein
MDFTPERRPMKSASYEASKFRYKKVVGKSGRLWLYPANGDPSYIHVEADPGENKPGYQGFRGYGGRTLTFILEDGTPIKLQGPWNGNADALYKDTGVDLRNNHMTFVVISLDRVRNDRNWLFGTFKDVVYIDKEPTKGKYERYKEIGQRIANQLGKPVFYYMESSGGASSGQILPEEEQ